MVKIQLIVEGGTYTDNVSAGTADNVESLRESLHKFFNSLLNREDIEITIFMGAGYRNAAKVFVKDNSFGLFVDSDCPPEEKGVWFDKLINKEYPEKSIEIPAEKRQYVFFMVQEMEAWFLKQPECLVRWAEKEGYKRKDADMNIADHSLIKGKDIEYISKPSEKLAVIMKRFFYKEKKAGYNREKAAEYNKLKSSPVLFDSLDVKSLLRLDAELRRFVDMFGNISA